jgi:hypothetical protein
MVYISPIVAVAAVVAQTFVSTARAEDAVRE